MPPHLRIARATDRLDELVRMYRAGLGLDVLGSFEDHDGFDGVMLGRAGAQYHFELTHQRGHAAAGEPGPEHLLVFYLPDGDDWAAACARMEAAGFVRVPAYNPYWETNGRTYADLDGYRVVLQRAAWPPAGAERG